jgi:hypothetical protein
MRKHKYKKNKLKNLKNELKNKGLHLVPYFSTRICEKCSFHKGKGHSKTCKSARKAFKNLKSSIDKISCDRKKEVEIKQFARSASQREEEILDAKIKRVSMNLNFLYIQNYMENCLNTEPDPNVFQIIKQFSFYEPNDYFFK